MSGTVRQLGEVCKIVAGQHIESTLYSNTEDGTPYLTGPADFGDRCPIISKWTNSPKVFATKGDILVTVKGNGVGKTNFGCDAAIGRQLMALRPNPDELDQSYLFQCLRAAERQVFRLAQGATVPGIGKDDLASLYVFLPPVAEQRRIAEVLDQAEALRVKRRAALAEIDTLTHSIFFDLFGDAKENAKGWPVCAVSDYTVGFQGGKSIESQSDENAATRHRVLKVSAVTGMRFLAHESKPVPDSYNPPEEHYAKVGDLLFSRANTTELVGAVAYVESTPPNVLLPDKLWRFLWRDPTAIEPLFIWALFQTSAVRREIGRRATGTSGSMKNISQEKVLGIRTIFPAIRWQRIFADRVRMVEKLKAEHRTSLTKMDSLFESLRHRAFRGEL